MAYEYTYRRRVQFAETDAAGIVHFSRYLCYAEEAEHAFLRSLGLSVHVPHEEYSVGFPRLSCRLEYQSPMRFEDEIDIHVWVRRKGKKSITYHFTFHKGDLPIARGEIVVVCCKCYAGARVEACEFPPDVAEAIQEAPYPPVAFREADAS